jgi:hypothetical protein
MRLDLVLKHGGILDISVGCTSSTAFSPSTRDLGHVVGLSP